MTDIADDTTFDRAELLYEQGRYDMAIQEYMKLISTMPDYYYPHLRIGMCLMNQDKLKEALNWYDDALRLNPNSDYTIYVRGFVLSQMNKNTDAIKCFRQAIEMNPNVSCYHADLAHSLLAINDRKNAEKESNLAIELDPEDARTWRQHAYVLSALGKSKEALAAADTALELEPDSLESHGLKGTLLASGGKFADSLHYFREALRLDPNAEWARKGYLDALRARNPAYRIVVGIINFRVPVIYFGHPAVMGTLLCIALIFGFNAVMLSFMAPHLLNVLLAFDPEGCSALDAQEIRRAKILGAYVVFSWIAGLALLPAIATMWFPAAFCLLFAAPILVTRIFEFEEHNPCRRKAMIYAGVGMLFGVVALATSVFSPELLDNNDPQFLLPDFSYGCLIVFILMCFCSRRYNHKEALKLV